MKLQTVATAIIPSRYRSPTTISRASQYRGDKILHLFTVAGVGAGAGAGAGASIASIDPDNYHWAYREASDAKNLCYLRDKDYVNMANQGLLGRPHSVSRLIWLSASLIHESLTYHWTA